MNAGSTILAVFGIVVPVVMTVLTISSSHKSSEQAHGDLQEIAGAIRDGNEQKAPVAPGDHIELPDYPAPNVQIESKLLKVGVSPDASGSLVMSYGNIGPELDPFAVINRSTSPAAGLRFSWAPESVVVWKGRSQQRTSGSACVSFQSNRKSELAANERLELTMLPFELREVGVARLVRWEGRFMIGFDDAFGRQYSTEYKAVLSQCPKRRLNHIHVELTEVPKR